jgi:hypothetical protein
MGGYSMKQFCLIPAYMLLIVILIFMPMSASASDRISEELNLQKELNLKSFDFEPKDVKMDGSGETVTFLAMIYADKGLMGKELADFATSATFLGPHSVSHPFQRDQITVTFLPPPILGDAKNGSYKGSLLLKSDTEEGFWQLDSIKLVDSTGSVRVLKGDDLGSLPRELEVQVGLRKWVTILLLIPLLFIVLLYLIYNRGLRKRSLSAIWKGYDGATSTSKLQFFLWTMAVLYAYIMIVNDAYFNHGVVTIGLSIPQNLILAMGLSAATMLAAKGISSSYADTEMIDKSDTSKGGLFFDDEGYPDMAKIQLMAWTFVGIGIFLLKTMNDIMGSSGATTQLPDIDGTLLALMGIGQGSYVGKKILTKDDQSAPRLNFISKSKGTLCDEDPITITGSNFGDDPSTCFVTIGGKKVKFSAEPTWEKGKVTFRLKDIDTSDKESSKVLPEKGKIQIGVIAGSKSSLEDMNFEIAAG